MRQEHLETLQSKLDGRPHVRVEQIESLDQWEEAGRPYEWKEVDNMDTDEGMIKLYTDRGYGAMAIFRDDNLEDISHNIDFVSTHSQNVVGIGPYLGFDYPKLFVSSETTT